MAARKRSAQSKGGWQRPQAETLRERFLWADFTQSEHNEIQAYCRRKRISVSQFMADLLLQDAVQPKAKRREKVILRPEIQLTSRQQVKLELLARLHQKKSIGDYILDVLAPELELRRLHAPAETKMVRYYLSDKEHATVTNHIADTGISTGNYAAMLALRTIRKDRTKRIKENPIKV